MIVEKHILRTSAFLVKFIGMIPMRRKDIDFSDVLGKDYFLFEHCNNIYIAKVRKSHTEYAVLDSIYTERHKQCLRKQQKKNRT